MVHSFDLTLKNINQKFDFFDLSVVIPVYNESLNISSVLKSWDSELKKNKISYCFVIVNDGSTDDSLKIIKSLRYNIFLLDKRNSGHGRSIRLGYDFSVNFLKPTHILQIDSDGQCDIKFFKDFWKIRNDYDFILGNRTTRGDGLIRKLTSKVSLYATSLLTSINLKDPNTPYRLFNYETLKKSLPLINESFDIHNIALTYVIFKGNFKVKTVDISFPNRIGGENSINVLKVFQMGLNMLFDLFFLKKRFKKL